MKRWVFSFLLCSFLFGFAENPGYANDKKEVVVWMWTAHVTEGYQTWYEKMIQWFEEENPGATIRFEFTSQEQLVAAVAAGNPPDVSLAQASRAQEYYDAGMFIDLNTYIESTPHMALDYFLPSSIQPAQKYGRVFGIPWSWEAKSIYYNTNHLAESGLDAHQGAIATWNDLELYAKRLVRKDPNGVITRSGFVNENNTISFISYLLTNGGKFYNDTATGVEFNNEKGIEALEFIRRVLHEFDVTRPGANIRDLEAETASIVMRNTSAIPTLEQQAPGFEQWLNMAPIPQGPQGVGVGGVSWSNLFVIPSGAENPDLGWKFIQLWLHPRVAVERFLHAGGRMMTLPRLDLLQSEEFIESLRRYPHMASVPEIFNTAGPYPNIRWPEINRAMSPLLTQVYRDGSLAAPAALSEAERIANAILQQ